ncbi:MAG: tyrosine-type recombinase/integrase [Polyangiaceae bacterium]
MDATTDTILTKAVSFTSTANATNTKDTADNPSKRGTVRWRGGKADLRLSLGETLGRKTFALPTCKTAAQAETRRAFVSELADRLIAAGRIEIGLPLIEKAAKAEGKILTQIKYSVEHICKGESSKLPTGETTFEDVATKWLTGELSRQFKDNVKPRQNAADLLIQLRAHVFKVIGHIPMSGFKLEHAQEAMRHLPDSYSTGTRRIVALLIHRIVGLSVFPLRLLPHNPLPKGFVPAIPPRKAMAHLYPDEDAKLLACRSIPLCDRVLYAFLAREGMRTDEAFRTETTDVDLERGAVALDTNKTNDPRAWALSPDVARALEVWEKLKATGDDRYFYHPLDSMRSPRRPTHLFQSRKDLAARLRKHLKEAGVARAALFEKSDTRQQFRAHDLRATFVTIGLANGRTETWIMDRTGHRSSSMVNHYRRAARTFAELNLGTLRPMDEAIPEIAEYLAAKRSSEERAAQVAAERAPRSAKPSRTAGASRAAAPTKATVETKRTPPSEAAQVKDAPNKKTRNATRGNATKANETSATAAASTASNATNDRQEERGRAPTSKPMSTGIVDDREEAVLSAPVPTLRRPSSSAASSGVTAATTRAQTGLLPDVMSSRPDWSEPGPNVSEASRETLAPGKTAANSDSTKRVGTQRDFYKGAPPPRITPPQRNAPRERDSTRKT